MYSDMSDNIINAIILPTILSSSYICIVISIYCLTSAGSCLQLPSGNHLHLSTESTFPGVNVTFACDSDYQLNGPQNVICMDGRWSDVIPSCTTGNVYRILENEPLCQNQLFFLF